MRKLLIGVIGVLFLGFIGFSYAVPTVSIQDKTVTSGTTTVEIPINIDDATGIAGFQFTVTFDSNILEATGRAKGDLTSGEEWHISANVNTPGQITVAGYSLDENTSQIIPIPGGSGSLVILQFNVVGNPGQTTDLTFTYSKLVDAQSNEISFISISGIFHITGYTLTTSVNPDGSGNVTKNPDKAEYEEGEEVQLTANANAGYVFVNWSGDVPAGHENENPLTITMDWDKTITANFGRQYTLTMAVDPADGGTTTPAVGDHVYGDGAVVNISATANPGYRFDHWEGDVADPNSPNTTVTIDGDKTVTAVFVKQYTLTMAVDPDGAGTTDPAVGDHTYDENTVVNISATANPGYRFDHWEGDVADPNSANTTVTMDGDKTVTAHFVKTYNLTINIQPDECTATTTPSAGTHTYDEGEVVNVTANENEDWLFDQWEGDVADPNSASTTVTMDSDKTITAVFVRNAPELSVNPTNVEFSFNIGNPEEPTQKDTQITIENTGAAGVLTWNVGTINYQEGAGWITTFVAGPTPAGQLNPGESVTIGLQVDRTGLSAGIYHATVPIESNAGTENINVTMRIDTPPEAAIISPDENTFTPDEKFIDLIAQFTDPDEGDEISNAEWVLYDETLNETVLTYSLNDNTEVETTLSIPWATLKPGHIYYWKVRCQDTFGKLWSEWAVSNSWNALQDNVYNQQHNVPEKNEILNAFNSLPDTVVSDVFKEAVNSETIVVGVDTGNLQMRSIDPAEIEGSEAFNIKYLFDIRIDGLTQGESAIVSIFIPGNYTGNWYKYNPVDETWTIYPNAEIVGTVTVDDQTYTRIDLTLTDGGDGDFDGEANGVIVDPSGFGPITGVSSVSGGGGGCFIATAAYGSYQEKHVWILRQFRDKYLLTNRPGKAFVRWYYRHSPKYASIIAQHPVLRSITRILLTPLYVSAYIVVKNLALPLFLFLLAFGGLVALRRKIKTGKIFLLIFTSLFLLFSTSSFAADTNLFKIAPGEKYTVVSPSSETIGKGKLKVDFFYSYADNPVEGKVGGVNKDLISDQSLIQIGATYGLTDKFDVSLTVPYLIDQDSDLTTVDDNGFGDIYLSGKYQILNKKNSIVGAAIIPFVGFDTGEGDALISANSTVFGVKFAFDKDISDNLIFTFNLGYSHQDEEKLGQIEIEDTFLFGISLTYLVNKKLHITGEIYGRSDDGFFDYEEAYPVEGAISIGYQFKNFDFIFGGATAITDGYGTSNYRIFTGIKVSL